MIGLVHEAFVIGLLAGALFVTAFYWFSLMDEQTREAREAWRRANEPDLKCSEAGKLGAAVTNAKRRTRSEAERQLVLETAEKMRRDMAAKKKEPTQ